MATEINMKSADAKKVASRTACLVLALSFACSSPGRDFENGGASGQAGSTSGTSGASDMGGMGGHSGDSENGATSGTAGMLGGAGSSQDGGAGAGGAPPVDACAMEDPCINGGVCSTEDDQAVCTCDPAYEGQHCEINVDGCASNPCENDGTCIDTTGSYACTCPTGFSGERCERAVSKCQDEPCLNGGTCADQAGSYECTCPDGFSGTNCELNVDDCAASPCKNGAACVDGVDAYTCQCKPGYSGTTCQTNSNDCAPNPCQNGSTCVDGVNGYTCQCKPGYSGTTCQTNINDCAPNPCQNGGTCADGVNAYTCQCKAGYSGTTCQTNINDCAPNPCQNGGTCADGVNAYTCSCSSRYTGTACQYLEVKLAPTNLGANANSTKGTALSNDGAVLLFQYMEGNNVIGRIARLVDFDAANLVDLSPPLKDESSYGNGIDKDGSTIVGSAISSNDDAFHAIKHVGASSSIYDVSHLPYSGASNRLNDVSADGTTVVGVITPGSGIVDTFYCKGAQACKMVPLEGSGWLQMGALAVNGDGTVIVGYTIPTDHSKQGMAWRWLTSNAMGTALTLSAATWTVPRANGVSRDGLVVVGEALINGVSHAVRWSGQSLSPTDLGTGRATATSANGSVTVGVDNSGVPLVWFGTTRNTLATLLGSNPDLNGATLTELVAVSDDGKVVGGTAKVGGVDRAFMARLP